MKIGKVPENVLKRSVFKQIKSKREEVLVHPGVGEDCAVLGLAPDEVFVLSTDPITGAVSDIGTLAVHVTANDLASAGAEGSQTGTGYRRYKMGWAGRNIHYRFGTGGGAVYAVQPGIC